LTVTANAQASKSTFKLTITGTSGTLVGTTSVTVTVQ
jgi:hypothetical protein